MKHVPTWMPDWDELSEHFAVTKRHTYLAKAAITPIPMPVYNEVSKYYNDILIHGRTLWNESAKIERTRTCLRNLLEHTIRKRLLIQLVKV